MDMAGKGINSWKKCQVFIRAELSQIQSIQSLLKPWLLYWLVLPQLDTQDLMEKIPP